MSSISEAGIPASGQGSRRSKAPSLGMAFTVALRELRGGLKGFRIFLACLFLGVAAIAVVGSLSTSIEQGLKNDGRSLLGGDLALNLVHYPATDEQLDWLNGRADVSRIREMNAMARVPEDGGKRSMVELRGVDSVYPLFGTVDLSTGQELKDALAFRDGHWGIVAPASIVNKLGLSVGDKVMIGETAYEIRAELEKQPDLNSRAFSFAASVIVADESLDSTNLIQPGSLIRHDYRLVLPEGSDVTAFRTELESSFPDAGWRIRDSSGAAPRITRFVGILGTYLTLVGLATLLVGGVGIANAVKSHLDRKVATIATLKCLGADAGFIFKSYLIQILGLSVIGILAGLAVGAITPTIAAVLTEGLFNWSLAGGVFVAPLLIAAAFGLLTVLVFSTWALSRAGLVPPARLFRDLTSPITGRPTKPAMLFILLCVMALAAVSLVFAHDPKIAGGFLVGTAVVFALYQGAGSLVTRLSRKLPRVSNPAIRTALSNLGRPGAPTGSIILSVGMGLTVLVIVALLEANVRQAINQSLPEEAPGFYFIDIQPDQVEEFDQIVNGFEGIEKVQRVPMLRGRISAVNGRDPQSYTIPEDIEWIFRSDRGLTWSADAPEGTELASGTWWSPDYDGPPLVSIDDRVVQGLGLKLGDSLTLNILGRELDVEIANTRDIDWSGLQINFVMVFSPGVLSRAPQTHIATIKASPDIEDELEVTLTDRFHNISSVRVKEALAAVTEILNHVSLALTVIAGLTLAVGVLVLGGAIAASNQRRVYDTVVLKVLGASRKALATTFFVEFGVLGLIAAVFAALVGTAGAWVVTTVIFKLDFVLASSVIVLVPLSGLLCAVIFGYLGTWSALRQRPAALLRNE
ncbi:ABC transporter permease [Kiloniella sp. b19]|uniref:ABC transporter permease n=1 Tax=Kiloniella sp. GXU_MW_B19 TaxID=3141326 RepID=UPI0031DC3DFA